MTVTYQDVKGTYPKEKGELESIYARIIPVRKLSFLVAIPFIKMGISAFAVSIFSIFIALSASVFIALPSAICRIIGVGLVPVWHLFDCVDGNIARYNKASSEFGSVADAISGYYMFAFFPLALGIASFNIADNYLGWHPFVFLILGGIASISNMLMRLIHQKYAMALQKLEGEKAKGAGNDGDTSTSLKGFQRVRHIVDVECTICGVPMFVLWAAPFFNLFHILTVYYFVLFSGSLIFMTAYYLKKSIEYASRSN